MTRLDSWLTSLECDFIYFLLLPQANQWGRGTMQSKIHQYGFALKIDVQVY